MKPIPNETNPKMKPIKIISVVGARPNFMKIAPFARAINAENRKSPGRFEHLLVHTGQHYDRRMSQAFFDSLNIPPADIDLEIGSGTHAEQVGQTMIAFEKVVRAQRPDWVVVVGDVNATCACAITAKKEHLKLAHIEAGLRSFDLEMPEEINRMVTDRLSDLLFTTDSIASQNLRHEGVPEERIKMVGNIMIDTLETQREKAAALKIEEIISANQIIGSTRSPSKHTKRGQVPASTKLDRQRPAPPSETPASYNSPGAPASNNSPGVPAASLTTRRVVRSPRAQAAPPTEFTTDNPYALITMHRPANVDKQEILSPILDFLLEEVCSDMVLIWPIHPRTQKQLKKFSLWDKAANHPNCILLNPLDYHEMLRLNMDATLMLTDSGGLQEECCVLGTPCMTLRWNTERPVTLREHGGGGVLVGNAVDSLHQEYRNLRQQPRTPQRPPLWDGHTAARIVAALQQ